MLVNVWIVSARQCVESERSVSLWTVTVLCQFVNSEYCVSVWIVSVLYQYVNSVGYVQCVDSECCVSLWTVSAMSVCGQCVLCQCVDSERAVLVFGQ